ncbi:MAG: leucine-rich repeat protein [Paludibacteraceae bacterium]|nr:leucine-rich repeat protein [Paludibacteraceae bacterium]
MKKIMFSFICALVSLSAMAAFEKDGFWYYLNGSGAVVTYAHDAQDQPIAGYYKGDVVIPDSVESYGTKYAVQYIGENAFQGCPDMTSLTIPATIKRIEGTKSSFEGTPLTSITINNSSVALNIYADLSYKDGDALMALSSSLKTVYQGRNVRYDSSDPYLPRTVLNHFTALESVVFGENVNSLQDSLYSDCKALKHIECRSTTPPYVWSALTDIDYENIELLVPKYYGYAYQNAAFWGKFTNVVEPEYPKQLEWRNMLPVNGEDKYYVTTDMALQALAALGAANDSVQAQFGYYRDKFNAKVSYRHGKEQDMETETLLANYPNTIWRVQQNVSWALSETDTAYVIVLEYYTDQWLSFYNAAVTGYTLYVGYPYVPQEVSNPLGLDVVYSSSDATVATVDAKTGKVSVLKDGVTTITATCKKSEEEVITADYEFTVEKGSYYDIVFVGKKKEDSYGMERIQLTKENAHDIFGDGKVSFDYETGVLTLNNYRRHFSEDERGTMGWSEWMSYSSIPQVPVAIDIIGDCRITNNSAGIGASAPIIIRGKGENATLVLDGYFTQLGASNLTIDNVDVHTIEHSPHPNVTCDTLTVTNKGYIEMYNTIADEAPDATEEEILSWGARAGQANKVIMDEDIKILTTGVTLRATDSQWEDGVMTFYLGNRPALRVEIGPAPVVPTAQTSNVSFGAIEIDDDPKGTVIDGVRYTFTTDDSVDLTDECIVLQSTMDATKIDELLNSLVPGTAEFADRFHGLSFLLPAGEGEVYVTTQTFGSHELNIKVGTNAAVAFTKTEKGEVKVEYNCTEPTMVYIYAVETAPKEDAAPRYVPVRFAGVAEAVEDASTGSVRIYSMKIAETNTALEGVEGQRSKVESRKLLRDGRIVIVRDGITYDLMGTEVK